MKTTSMKTTALALLPAALLALASCNTGMPGEQTSSVKKTATGTTVVETFKATATVTSIDSANRKLTLRMSNGKRKVVKCGPEIVNFPSESVVVPAEVPFTNTETPGIGVLSVPVT